MLKKIPVGDLRLGMHVQALEGRWLDHPFWRTSFKLAKPEDLQALLQSGIPEVIIDTRKGLDVAIAPPPPSEPAEPGPPIQPAVLPEARVTFAQEIDRAKQIHGRAKQAVIGLFDQARMGNTIDVTAVMPLVDEINSSIARNAGALLSIVRLKTADDYTYLHSVAVCALMISLGQRLGLQGEVLRQAGMGGLLHDIGKMGVPLEILKKPDKLTDDEFTVIKTHPVQGWEILKRAKLSEEIALDVCLHHHEKVDGSGYPEKISGERLTLYARMCAVCDVYDAVTSNRAYKLGWTPAEAIKRMARWSSGHFDETVFQTFVKTIGIYPVGSLLRLKSGRLAVVVDQSEKDLLTPKVKVFYSTKSQAPIMMEVLDLSRSQDSIEGLEDAAAWGFDLDKIIGV